MADFNALEALINAHIKKNGVQAITGNILNGILRGMVAALGKGYTIAGSASPATDPGTMTGPLAYIAYTAGTYTHFGGLEVEQGEVAMLIYNEAEWHKEVLFSLAASATIDGNVGTPEVGVSFVDGQLTFDFRNMKGNPGDPAGFGTVNATVDDQFGTPSVSVQSSGPDTAKNFTFAFHNLKGETGVTSVVATVDNTSGTPSCAVSLQGQQLTLAFTGLKGAQGNTGVSADYPIAIINNLTTDDPASALSAAQGVVLDGKVSQLEAKVDSLPRGKDYGFFTSSSLLPSGATEEGFAYVGASEPYAIWQFDGTTWTDSGVTANAFTANQNDVQDAVDEYLEEHPAVIGTMPNSAKRALIALLEKVAFVDQNGQQYIDTLNAALNDVPIDHIEAVFTQGTRLFYDNGLSSLDDLREKLVVTAYFVDGTHGVIEDYELSGTLTAGTSTITVTADEATDTFDVVVTATLKLYHEGDECTSVTGGWQTKGFNMTAGSPSKTKEASDLLLRFGVSASQAAASWSTTNKITLTGYNRIVVKVEAYNASGRGTLWGYWPATLSEATSQTSAYGSDYSSNRVSIREMGRESDTSTYPFPAPAEEKRIMKMFGTSRTQAYLSINLNLYTDNNVQYTAGAYVKIKQVFLANVII